jgi:hypothetical protein
MRKFHPLVVFCGLLLVLTLFVTKRAVVSPPYPSFAGVVYALIDPVPSGTKLQFPRVTIEVPWEALLAFVDRDPRANWGHSCRYLLVNRATGEVHSTEARFPPFRREDLRRWRVVFQAPGVPDSALAVPKE